MNRISALALIAAAVLALYPCSASAQSAAAPTIVFPLVADGTANGIVYRSSIKIIPDDHTHPALQCTLIQRGSGTAFTGLYGDRYFADVFDIGDRPAAKTSIVLDPYLPWEVLRSTAASGLAVGYATLSCSAAAHAQLHVSLSDIKGIKLGESTLPPASPGRSFEFLLDRRDGTRLGFSLVNESAVEGEYTVIARDEFNQEVDRAYGTLGAWAQISAFIDEMLRLPSSFVGSIEVLGVDGGRCYAAGLQFTGPIFAVVPPIVRDSPLRF